MGFYQVLFEDRVGNVFVTHRAQRLLVCHDVLDLPREVGH
jgi:hypothetical protein